jgi:hypothetical protein
MEISLQSHLSGSLSTRAVISVYDFSMYGSLQPWCASQHKFDVVFVHLGFPVHYRVGVCRHCGIVYLLVRMRHLRMSQTTIFDGRKSGTNDMYAEWAGVTLTTYVVHCDIFSAVTAKKMKARE